MKSCVINVIALSLGAFGSLSATVIGNPMNYTYDLTLPTITGSAENDNATFDFQFSWLGPLMSNAGPGTACPLGCPVDGSTPGSPWAGYAYEGDMYFTASVSPDCVTTPSGACPEVVIPFTDTAGDTIAFTLVEPDSFWVTPGSQSFGQGDGMGGIGASWDFSPASGYIADIADPPCMECFVTITQSSHTPEPASLMLITSGIAGVAFATRRRRQSKSLA